MANIRYLISRIVRNKSFRNGIFFSLFSFLNSGISFLIMMLMARYVQPESYGKLSLFTTMISLLSIFICLNTNGMIGVKFFYLREGRYSTISECDFDDVVTRLPLIVYWHALAEIPV